MMHRDQARFLKLLAFFLLAAMLAGFQAGDLPRQTTVLYDGRLGGTPDQQGLAYISLFASSASQRYADGKTILDTWEVATDQAGYFGPSSLLLDRQLGYSIFFSGQVLAEAHSGRHRAGFTLLFLSDDLLGLEIGFWEDEIWVQEGNGEALFTRAEGVAFDTTAELTAYELAVQEESYALIVDGQTILTGALREYTAFEGFPDVYETPNLLFLGDNTRRAGAETAIAYVAVQSAVLATSTPAVTPTATASRTPLPTRTPRPTVTATPTLLPTAVPTATPLPTPTPTRGVFWWLPWLR